MSQSAAIPDSDAWAVDLGGIHVVFGEGTLAALGEAARELGGRRVLLVTDRGLERVGHARHAEDSLRGAGLEVAVFDGVVATRPGQAS